MLVLACVYALLWRKACQSGHAGRAFCCVLEEWRGGDSRHWCRQETTGRGFDENYLTVGHLVLAACSELVTRTVENRYR